jgi:integrase
MKDLVRLWKRPSRDGKRFSYVLIFNDEIGKTRYESLGHADRRKALRQRTQKERELRMGIVEPDSMRLSDFLADSLRRSRGQVTESTLQEYDSTMRHFINIVGDIDYGKVCHEHGEYFIQKCIDGGNTPATAKKKIMSLKRLFNLAVQRGQLDKSPLRYVSKPKVTEGEIHVYSDEECEQLVKAAGEVKIGAPFRWDIFILTALSTGMRRGELLNSTWRDVDFAGQKIRVSPKEDTEHTWEWRIKDAERRTVPLTDEVVRMLAEHQAAQPEGYPYVFVTPRRYDNILKLRRRGNWTVRQGRCPVSNFRYQFLSILERAGIDEGTFHDLRRTCITNWFAHGLSEFEVMVMAGHSSFETTRKFYLAVRKDIIDRARKASAESLKSISVAHLLRAPSGA